MGIRSKEFEEILNRLVDGANSAWDLERLELALHEARAKVSNKRFKLKQTEFQKNVGGK